MGAGEHLFMAWCGVPDPGVAEALVRGGFDAALFDMQHGSFEVSSATAGILAMAAAGKPALVRIPVGDFTTASRMLDAGAAGIVAPMINSADDARSLASFCKLPPLGRRSWGPARALSLTGMDGPTYLRSANEMQLAIAMIETREAIAALDEILAVPGIDGVLIGPSDLSIALSDGTSIDPHGQAVDDVLALVVRRTQVHGKIAACFCADGGRAKAVSALGFQLCSIGTDGTLLAKIAGLELGIARS